MTAPFRPLTSNETRGLLKEYHDRDHEVVPGIILRHLIGLREGEAAEAEWTHLSRPPRFLRVPSRRQPVRVPVVAYAWLLLYKPKDILSGERISPLPPEVWAARFHRLIPQLPISHLRRSWLYYRRLAGARRRPVPFGAIRGCPNPRMESIRLAFFSPDSYAPPIEAPINRVPLVQPILPTCPVTLIDLELA